MQQVRRLSIPCLLSLIICCTSFSYAATLDESQVKQSFVEFQHSWMSKLKQHGKYGQENVQVSEDPSEAGTFIAKYDDLTDPTSSEIRKTGQKTTPYVGVLHYEKVTRVSRGKTPEEAKQGPFKPESEEGITEIFRFSKGKWVY